MHDSTPEITTRLNLAISMAKEAGQLTLKYFQKRTFEVERKSDNSPVTVADREAEQLLRQTIATTYPDDEILGEEFGVRSGTSAFRWILDPIDGTKSFICGVPLYGTLVGVEFKKTPVIGVIYIPGTDEIISAAKGAGAWYTNGKEDRKRARVSSKKSLAEATFLTSQVDSFEQRQATDVYREIEQRSYITRTWGDCYGYLLVATGRAEVMVDPIMNIWDAAPLQTILQEAGGTFTDWQGTPTISSGEGIATNGHLLEEVLAITRHSPSPS